MKKLIRNIMLMLAAPALLLTSCHESFDELNTDPTHMSEANAGSFLQRRQLSAPHHVRNVNIQLEQV